MKGRDLKAYYEKARKEGWAMHQFNWSCAEQLQGIALAAAVKNAPLLVGTSEGDSGFFGIHQAVALVGAWRKQLGIPIFLNFDHGKSFESIQAAIDAGYDAVHFDGSSLPLEENIQIAKKIVAYARKKKISVVEGEVGKVMGSSQMHRGEEISLDPNLFTDPAEAERFVKETRVDSLAITFGNVHGVYPHMPSLDFERLKEIQKRVESYIVLHGGSGIPAGDIERAISDGVVKINISTELRSAFADEMRRQLAEQSQEVMPYKLLPPVVRAVQKVVEGKMVQGGSVGRLLT